MTTPAHSARLAEGLATLAAILTDALTHLHTQLPHVPALATYAEQTRAVMTGVEEIARDIHTMPVLDRNGSYPRAAAAATETAATIDPMEPGFGRTPTV